MEGFKDELRSIGERHRKKTAECELLKTTTEKLQTSIEYLSDKNGRAEIEMMEYKLLFDENKKMLDEHKDKSIYFNDQLHTSLEKIQSFFVERSNLGNETKIILDENHKLKCEVESLKVQNSLLNEKIASIEAQKYIFKKLEEYLEKKEEHNYEETLMFKKTNECLMNKITEIFDKAKKPFNEGTKQKNKIKIASLQAENEALKDELIQHEQTTEEVIKEIDEIKAKMTEIEAERNELKEKYEKAIEDMKSGRGVGGEEKTVEAEVVESDSVEKKKVRFCNGGQSMFKKNQKFILECVHCKALYHRSCQNRQKPNKLNYVCDECDQLHN